MADKSKRKLQGDYKLCERLHKFIGNKVIATQKLNTHHCKQQLKKSIIPCASPMFTPSVDFNTSRQIMANISQ
jgi:hypothetical protein